MENVITNKKVGIKDLFPHKAYLTILLANLISRFGDALDSIAYSILVYELTGSMLLMGTLFAINAVPGILFSAFTGVLVDYFPKKRTIIMSDIGRGLIVALTALLFLLGRLEVWHLFLFTFLNSTLETFANPAKTSLLPLFLPKELMLSASSFSSSAMSFAEIIGLSMTGILIITIGVSGAIFIDAGTFFLSSLLITFLKIKEDNEEKEKLSIKSYFHDLKEGINYVRKEIVILLVIIVAAVSNFCLTPINVLLYPYVKDVLKEGTYAISIIATAFPIGIIIGGLIMAQFGSRFRKAYAATFGLSAIGMSYALLSLIGKVNIPHVSPVVFAAIIFFMFGVFMMFFQGPIRAHLLTTVPKRMLGRIVSLMGMFTLSAVPLGGAISGAIAEYLSISSVFLLMGIIMALVALLPLLNKDFRNA